MNQHGQSLNEQPDPPVFNWLEAAIGAGESTRLVELAGRRRDLLERFSEIASDELKLQTKYGQVAISRIDLVKSGDPLGYGYQIRVLQDGNEMAGFELGSNAAITPRTTAGGDRGSSYCDLEGVTVDHILEAAARWIEAE